MKGRHAGGASLKGRCKPRRPILYPCQCLVCQDGAEFRQVARALADAGPRHRLFARLQSRVFGCLRHPSPRTSVSPLGGRPVTRFVSPLGGRSAARSASLPGDPMAARFASLPGDSSSAKSASLPAAAQTAPVPAVSLSSCIRWHAVQQRHEGSRSDAMSWARSGTGSFPPHTYEGSERAARVGRMLGKAPMQWAQWPGSSRGFAFEKRG